jgi:acyl-coenzyme A synthetase/AMP-(fatty) acid ligase/acyl carrier protein
MAKPEGHRDSTFLVNAIIDNNITTLQVVPSQLQMLLNEKRFENCLTLRRVFCGGEALTIELFNQFMAHLPTVELINLYGPTEATIDTTFWRCHQQQGRPIMPIGRPIGNMQVYILDPYLNIVPVGVQGELHIAGPGIGRGYLNRPDLTAEKFVSNPFPSSISTSGGLRNWEDKIGGRLYKSGDLARYLPNGSIEFIGRSDYQVKIHGFRIELGEVESVLSRHPTVEEAVVIVREDVPGDKRLVTYLVARHEPTPTSSDLRSFLKEKLPDYMIPSAFVFPDAFPITPHGKVDRRALPAPEQSRSELEAVYVAPQSEVERIIAEVWQQVLRIEQVGMHDNFFDLGGHSLLLIQIHNKFQELFKKEIPITDIFRYPTIKTLADHLAQEEKDRVSIQQTSDSIEKLAAGKNRMKQLYKRRQQTKEKR